MSKHSPYKDGEYDPDLHGEIEVPPAAKGTAIAIALFICLTPIAVWWLIR